MQPIGEEGNGERTNKSPVWISWLLYVQGPKGLFQIADFKSLKVSVERDRLFWECVDPSQQPANYLTSSPPQLSSSPAAANTPQLASTPDMFADSLDSL